MLIEGVKNKIVETLIERFLKNSGIKDIVDNPQKYETTLTFEEDGISLKIKRR